MNRTLIARLENLSQYKPEKQTIKYEDAQEKRWRNTGPYGQLVSGDKGIFFSDGRILIGDVNVIEPNKAVHLCNVEEFLLRNDDFLKINSVNPELIATTKANFHPLVTTLDIGKVKSEIKSSQFISFYILAESKFEEHQSILKDNDRVVLIDENLKLTSINIYKNEQLVAFPFDKELFLTKGQSLDTLEKMQRAAGKHTTADAIPILAGRIRENGYYQFRTFSRYYNIIHNKRLYRQLQSNLHLSTTIFPAKSEDLQPKRDEPTGKKINISPLNTILYGPPGTGKTYHTITKAAEIITGESFKDRYSDAKAIYKDALEKGQIEFVTFHQNYSYEDFVAGLRPETNGSQLHFKEHKGVFYRISKKAEENYLQSKMGDHPAPDFDTLLDKFLSPLDEPDKTLTVPTLAGQSSFTVTGFNETHIDYLRGSEKKKRTLRIGRVKELYYNQFKNTTGGPNDYHEAFAKTLKEFGNKQPIKNLPVDLKPYVLIIDEINRANISRVFGELITLLEPDKRLSTDPDANTLTLRLPGLPEDERFGVPPNLYIVGTMNTADKSIALIDIALRRRFVFEDMYPREEIVNEVVPQEYRSFLLALNKKIREQKSADFMIGHAYFIPEKDKALNILQVLNQKVIPLLNEYFYNQRNNPVWNLLSGLQDTLAGVQFEQDEFIGVKTKAV